MALLRATSGWNASPAYIQAYIQLHKLPVAAIEKVNIVPGSFAFIVFSSDRVFKARSISAVPWDKVQLTH